MYNIVSAHEWKVCRWKQAIELCDGGVGEWNQYCHCYHKCPWCIFHVYKFYLFVNKNNFKLCISKGICLIVWWSHLMRRSDKINIWYVWCGLYSVTFISTFQWISLISVKTYFSNNILFYSEHKNNATSPITICYLYDNNRPIISLLMYIIKSMTLNLFW